MTPGEVVGKLVVEHFDILLRDQELKDELVEVLVDQKMTEFFSVNWRRLHREFIARPRSKER